MVSMGYNINDKRKITDKVMMTLMMLIYVQKSSFWYDLSGPWNREKTLLLTRLCFWHPASLEARGRLKSVSWLLASLEVNGFLIFRSFLRLGSKTFSRKFYEIKILLESSQENLTSDSWVFWNLPWVRKFKWPVTVGLRIWGNWIWIISRGQKYY